MVIVPLNAMVGPDNSKDWRSRTFIALVAEAARNERGSKQKLDFVEEQLARYNETWGIVRDLANIPETGVRITIDFSLAITGERTFFQKQAWDYTAQEIDTMLERVHKIMDSIEASKRSKEGL